VCSSDLTHRFLARGIVAISLLALTSLFFVAPKTAIYAHFGALIIVKLATIAHSYRVWRSDSARLA